MTGKPLVLYHAPCLDGFGAAYSVWRSIGNNAEYKGINYGDPVPDVNGRDVWMIDFSFKRPQMERVIAQANSVLVLDHHKSAQQELEGLDGPGVEIHFDMNRSGARMAWEYFNKGKRVPYMIQLIEDRDLWLFNYEETMPFSLALRSYPYDFDTWYWIQQNVGVVAQEGTVIKRFYDKKVEELLPNAYQTVVAGKSVPVCNAPWFVASDLANVLCPGHPFAVVYHYTGREWRYSLRSDQDGADVSEIAKQYGGGGHQHAAGFETEKLIV